MARMSKVTPQERAEIAAAAKLNDQYIYQCLTGRREMSTAEAVEVERVSGGRIRRWELRTKTWHRHWPELIGTEGAPDVAHVSQPQETAA